MADMTPASNESQAALIRRPYVPAYPPVEYIEVPAMGRDDEASGGADVMAKLAEFWQIVRRHWVVTVASGLLFTLGAGLYATFPKISMYRAVTTIAFGNDEVPSIGKNPFGAQADYVYIPSQIRALQSSALVETVLRKIRNNYKPEFTSGLGRVWGLLKEKGLPVRERVVSSEEALLMTANSLKVDPARDTPFIVQISSQSPDPKMAADFVNTLVAEYSNRTMAERWERAQKTMQFLNHQLEDLKGQLQNSEAQLQNYAEEYGMSEGGGTVAEQKLQQLQTELSAAQATLINAQSKDELVKSVSPDNISDVIDSAILSGLQTRLTDFQTQMADLTTSFTAEHPRVVRLQAQINSVEQAIKKERTNLINRIRHDYEVAAQKEQKIQLAYDAQSAVVTAQADRNIHYDIMKREVDTNRLLYQSVLQQVKEAGINSVVRGSSISVLDEAKPKYVPDGMNAVQIVLFGMCGGLMLGVGYSFVREKGDHRLKSPGAVASQLKMTELGVIPSASLTGQSSRLLPMKLTSLALGKSETVELTAWTNKKSLFAESFRAAVTSILFSSNNGHTSRVLVVTSPQMSEGKTTAVCNLGISLAEIGQRVVLIDADLRHPRLRRIFGIKNNYGLANILEEESLPEGQTGYGIPTEVPNLDVIPAGSPKSSISRLLHSSRMIALLEELRGRYDAVLIDTPPILHVPDARVLGRIADGVVLVFRAGSTPTETAVAARQRFDHDGVHVLGCILNDWDPKTDGYGHGYYGTYYQNYSERPDESE